MIWWEERWAILGGKREKEGGASTPPFGWGALKQQHEPHINMELPFASAFYLGPNFTLKLLWVWGGGRECNLVGICPPAPQREE